MANTISSLKRVRQTERRTAVNRQNLSQLRTEIRRLRRLVSAKDVAGAMAAMPKTFSLIDRSAKRGLIKKNTAARYKSRMHLKLKALEPAK